VWSGSFDSDPTFPGPSQKELGVMIVKKTRWLVMGYHPSLVGPMNEAVRRINCEASSLIASSSVWLGQRSECTRVAIAWRNALRPLGLLVRVCCLLFVVVCGLLFVVCCCLLFVVSPP